VVEKRGAKEKGGEEEGGMGGGGVKEKGERGQEALGCLHRVAVSGAFQVASVAVASLRYIP